MPATKAISSTSQQYLDIYDVSDDLVILKDGAVSVILTVTAMNFGLLAEEEQDAIIYGYAGLLNSLNYPIQILVRSQTKDVTSYLQTLKTKEDETMNRSKKDQIRRYREFITDLVRERNVLDKKFYVIVPATALELGLVSTQSVIPGVKTADVSTFERSVVLERAKNILEPKRDHIIAQFSRIGLFSRQLKTQEIISLFYTIYNPEATEGQQVTDTRNYTTSLVEGSLENQVSEGNRSRVPEKIASQQPFHFPDAGGGAAATPAADMKPAMPEKEVGAGAAAPEPELAPPNAAAPVTPDMPAGPAAGALYPPVAEATPLAPAQV